MIRYEKLSALFKYVWRINKLFRLCCGLQRLTGRHSVSLESMVVVVTNEDYSKSKLH
jgi:hypothetical protein